VLPNRAVFKIKSGAAARHRGGASRAALSLGGPLARARRPARHDHASICQANPELGPMLTVPSSTLPIVQLAATASMAALTPSHAIGYSDH